jgi:hypothetical protein
MNTDTAPGCACRAALPQRPATTHGHWKLHDLPGRKGPDCTARTAQCVWLPFQMERMLGKRRPLAHGSRLAENSQGIGALLPQLPGQVRLDRVGHSGLWRVGRCDSNCHNLWSRVHYCGLDHEPVVNGMERIQEARQGLQSRCRLVPSPRPGMLADSRHCSGIRSSRCRSIFCMLRRCRKTTRVP